MPTDFQTLFRVSLFGLAVILGPWAESELLALALSDTPPSLLTVKEIRRSVNKFIGTKVTVSVGQITPCKLRKKGFWLYYADTVLSDGTVEETLTVAIPTPFFAEAEDLQAFKGKVGTFISRYNYQVKALPWRKFPQGGVPMTGTLVQNGSSLALVVDLAAKAP